MALAHIELRQDHSGATGAAVDELRLGIVGAGTFGTTLARVAVAALTTAEVVRHADVVVLAVPTHRFRELPSDLFAGKVLVDATNYWQPVDGDDPELTGAADGTSTIVQASFPSARVVKSLNQLGYHQLEENARRKGAPGRIAIGAAGDDPAAVSIVMRLLDRLGFDPVDAGPLENGLALEPDGSPIATTYSADQLAKLVSR